MGTARTKGAVWAWLVVIAVSYTHLADPFVVRVDERFQLVVGHFQLREGLSASDDRAAHAAPSLAALSRRAFNALIIKLNGL